MMLNQEQKELLSRVLSSRVENRSCFEVKDSASLSDLKIDQICNWINDEFMMHGLTEDGEPNAYGFRLEALLDTVNRQRTKPS